MFAKAQVQRRVTTSLRGDWVRFGVEAKEWTRLETTEGYACSKKRPACDLSCKGAGTKLRRKLPKPGRGLTTAADHIGGVRLSGPLSPAPVSLWGSWENAQPQGDTHSPLTRGPGRQRPPTPRPQPSVAPGPRPASGHIRRIPPGASRAPPQPRVVRPSPAPCHQ